MTDTETIRNKVLLLALQGKLTEQLAEDGHAQNLYEEIQLEKQKLIQLGKLKGKVLPKIAENEIPFSIPKNWMWIRWGELSESIQYGYNAPAKTEGRIKMVRISDIQDGNVMWDAVPYCDIDEKDIEEYLLHKNDILFARTGGTVGKSYIVSEIPYHAVFAGYLIRTSYSSKLCAQYMKYFMESSLYWKQLQSGTIATAQPNCNGNKLAKMIVPLPPYEEQVRIVDMLDKMYAILDTIDEHQNVYTLNAEILKSKLIDAGIQGKLTERFPEDGTAEKLYVDIQEEKVKLIKEKKIKKEKRLAEITEAEIPFDIPAHWKWVRLADVANRVWAGGDKPNDFAPIASEGRTIPVVANGVTDDGILGYTSEAKAPAETITVAGRGTIGFCTYRNYEYCPIVRLIVIEPSRGVNPKYLKLVMNALQERSVGSSIPQLTVPMIKPKLIPLPPYKEQLRIVDRIDEILSLI